MGYGSLRMKRAVEKLEPFDSDGDLNVIIETPKGYRNKFSYDEKLGLFRLKKALPEGMVFPLDFGFIPGTLGGDGDPLDVLVLNDEPAFPGCLVRARVLAIIEAEQTDQKGKRNRNDRLIAAALLEEPAAEAAPDELGKRRLHEIEQFFAAYNELEGKKFKVLRERGPKHAKQLVKQAQKAYRKKHHAN